MSLGSLHVRVLVVKHLLRASIAAFSVWTAKTYVYTFWTVFACIIPQDCKGNCAGASRGSKVQIYYKLTNK